MRAITTATAAAALGVERKTLDNILSRSKPPILPSGRQGVSRRIPVSLLAEIALVIEISSRLGTPVARAWNLVRSLSDGRTDIGPYLLLKADFGSVRADLDDQLELAIESVVRRPRGRPATRRR